MEDNEDVGVKCDWCGEFARWDDPAGVAEMYDPNGVHSEHKVGHYDCGAAEGWELA